MRADEKGQAMDTPAISTIQASETAVILLDQRALPQTVTYLTCTDGNDVIEAIRSLAVRGAPAIGIAAAYGLWLFARQALRADDFWSQVQHAVTALKSARPTAVNLAWAVDLAYERMRSLAPQDAVLACRQWADSLLAQDITLNQEIGRWGTTLFDGSVRILTHCNTGALATGGYGTALGVIRSLYQAGRLQQVWVDETRPLLQGARLTAWELDQEHIPAQLITDSMAGTVMAQHMVDGVIVGADRIAANGDTANKIGTYTVAVLAAFHQIPFYVAAPLSTFDIAAQSGADIPIELRAADEVRRVGNAQVAPENFPVYNPAFDITPGSLVAAFITEKGIISPPFSENIPRLISKNV
ncbi:S-methyl-5-thioribose-1-phosphate isomerase [Sulfobacillus sp. hq2]|uniref:S-methyl-5-thioribose-1-phosphate isomerase n=1 Tax=Sulfobacillus TaxID=28033 RepID=UPI00269E0545